MRGATVFTDDELKSMLNDETVYDKNGHMYMSEHYFNKKYCGKETRKPSDEWEIVRIDNMIRVISNEKKVCRTSD